MIEIIQTARRLWRTPFYSAFVFLSLTFGIGVCTVASSLLDASRAIPRGATAPSTLVSVNQSHSPRSVPALFSLRDLFEMERLLGGRVPFASWTQFVAGLSTGRSTEVVTVEAVNGQFFEVLGVRALRGRLLGQLDEADPAPAVAVISEALWRRLLAGDTASVGTVVRLSGQSFQVVGIAPRAFKGVGGNASVWIPRGSTRVLGRLSDNDSRRWRLTARLSDSVGLEEIRSAIRGLARTLDQVAATTASTPAVPGSAFGSRAWTVGPAFPEMTWQETVRASGLVFLAPLLVLGVACANVATLTASRSEARAPERAVRRALGASRSRLVLAETLEPAILVVASTVAAAGLAQAAASVLAHQSSLAEGAAILADVKPSWRTFAACVASGAICALAAGLLPALSAVRRDGTGVSSTASVIGVQRRTLMILVQVMIAVGLFLIGAALYEQLRRTVSQRDGDWGRAAVLNVPLAAQPQHLASSSGLIGAARAQLDRHPGVEAWTAMTDLRTALARRVSVGRTSGFDVRATPQHAQLVAGTPSLFRVLGVQIPFGRSFTDDDAAGGRPVAVITARLARQLFARSDVVGERVFIGTGSTAAAPEIVGVAATAGGLNFNDIFGVIFVPLPQHTEQDLSLVAKPRSTTASHTAVAAAESLRRSVPELALGFVGVADQYLFRRQATLLMAARALGWLAVAALVLAMVGLHGLLSSVVSLRRHEFGVRMAIGARQRNVAILVLKDGVPGAILGLTLAVMLAVVLQAITATLVDARFSALSTRAVLLVTGLTLVTTAGASVFPVYRAARLNPASLLRQL